MFTVYSGNSQMEKVHREGIGDGGGGKGVSVPLGAPSSQHLCRTSHREAHQILLFLSFYRAYFPVPLIPRGQGVGLKVITSNHLFFLGTSPILRPSKGPTVLHLLGINSYHSGNPKGFRGSVPGTEDKD